MKTIRAAIVIAAMVAQLGLVAGPWRASLPDGLTKKVERSSVERSARIAFGPEFAGYISFVRERVPEGATVALPPMEAEAVLGHTGLMQYFLFPRRTTNCPRSQAISACASQLAGSDIYVLRVRDFPGDMLADRLEKRYVEFADGRGLLIPLGTAE